MVLPDAIDNDTGDKRIAGIGQPLGEFDPSASLADSERRLVIENDRESPLDFITQCIVTPAFVNPDVVDTRLRAVRAAAVLQSMTGRKGRRYRSGERSAFRAQILLLDRLAAESIPDPLGDPPRFAIEHFGTRGQFLGEVPRPPIRVDQDFDARRVARIVTARADHQLQQVAFAHRHLAGRDGGTIPVLECPAFERCRAMAQFPLDAISAGRIGVFEGRGNFHRAGEWTPPRGTDWSRRPGMNRDTPRRQFDCDERDLGVSSVDCCRGIASGSEDPPWRPARP